LGTRANETQQGVLETNPIDRFYTSFAAVTTAKSNLNISKCLLPQRINKSKNDSKKSGAGRDTEVGEIASKAENPLISCSFEKFHSKSRGFDSIRPLQFHFAAMKSRSETISAFFKKPK